MNGLEALPKDLAAAHAMLRAERAARHIAETQLAKRDAAIARQVGEVAALRLEIERLKLLLAKARREQFGRSSERGARLVAQLELQLAELEESASEEETAAELAAPTPEPVMCPRATRKPARRPLPEHLPRERIVYPAPCACPNCGGPVRKLGEDITESLEHARWYPSRGRWVARKSRCRTSPHRKRRKASIVASAS